MGIKWDLSEKMYIKQLCVNMVIVIYEWIYVHKTV